MYVCVSVYVCLSLSVYINLCPCNEHDSSQTDVSNDRQTERQFGEPSFLDGGRIIILFLSFLCKFIEYVEIILVGMGCHSMILLPSLCDIKFWFNSEYDTSVFYQPDLDKERIGIWFVPLA